MLGRLGAALGSGGAAAGLAACGQAAPGASGGASPGATAAPVEMEFLHFFTGLLWDAGFKPIVERFEATHPNVRWRGTAIPYGELHTKIVTLVAGGTPPDGMSVPSDRAAELIMRRLLRENDTYLGRDKSVPVADVYPARLENYRSGGKLYALPVDNGAEAVYYNKEHFDRAGVPYPKDDWTWDDLLEKARRLTRKDDPAGPVWGFEYRTTLHRFYSPFAGHGGVVLRQGPHPHGDRRRPLRAGPAVVPRPALQARRLAHAPASRAGAAGRRLGARCSPWATTPWSTPGSG